MKRIVIIIMALLLSGCTMSKKTLQKVVEAESVHIAMPDTAYAKALETLWNAQYPQYENVLVFDCKPTSELVSFQADIEWVSDQYAGYKSYQALSFEANGYQAPKALIRQELTHVFTPIQAQGYLFAYEDTQLAKLDMAASSLKRFEDMAEKGKGKYYYRHSLEEMLPLWTHNIEDTTHTMEEPINSKQVTHSIARFQSLYQSMGFVDELKLDADAIFSLYAFGLVDPIQMKTTTVYQNGTLHFSAMPTYEQQSCAPYATIYGFIASADCAYPEVVQSFMDMVRSKQGLQAYLDTGGDVAVIQEKDLKEFVVYDARRKEMIRAMNHSSLWDLSYIQEKPGISMKQIYEQQDLSSILQNGICARTSAESIQEEMSSKLIQWIKKQ